MPAAVSKTCLVRFDNNKYSVMASAVGRPVEIRAYAERIELRQDGRVVGEHRRVFGRDQSVFDPWHYVPCWRANLSAAQRGTVQGLAAPQCTGTGPPCWPQPPMATGRWWRS